MEISVTKLRDSTGILYLVKVNSKSAFTCLEVAQERGMKLSQVIKYMVGYDQTGKIYIMLVPGNKAVKLNKIRDLTGTKIKLYLPENYRKDLMLYWVRFHRPSFWE